MKAKIRPFEQHSERYDAWFDRHAAAYQSEVAAVRELWPAGAEAIEIGVGAGHFAIPLRIRLGIEPAAAMRRRATASGVAVAAGVAEHLPLTDRCCDAALMVTTICFVDDPRQSLREMFRILRSGGAAVVGFVDRKSSLGREYQRNRSRSVFYRDARFFSTREVAELLRLAGFSDLDYRQTLFGIPGAMMSPDPVEPGHGRGSFVVVRGLKQHRTVGLGR